MRGLTLRGPKLIIAALVVGATIACAALNPAPAARPITPAPTAIVTSATSPAATLAPSATSAPTTAPTSAPTSTASITRPPGGDSNPFGILISLNSPKRQSMVQSLGVAYFRPDQAISADQWDGQCLQCDLALQNGLKLILTVRANGGRQNPSSAPSDVAAYQKTVGDILAKYHPSVLVVENEEDSPNFYTGTPQDYSGELKAACEAAHCAGVKCANGGMVSNDVALVVWDDYFERGATAPACDFARRAFNADQAQLLCGVKTLDEIPAHERAALTKDKAFLQVYKTSGADYMNFHWYIADSNALGEAAAFL
jgi:hypothetical protein